MNDRTIELGIGGPSCHKGSIELRPLGNGCDLFIRVDGPGGGRFCKSIRAEDMRTLRDALIEMYPVEESRVAPVYTKISDGNSGVMIQETTYGEVKRTIARHVSHADADRIIASLSA